MTLNLSIGGTTFNLVISSPEASLVSAKFIDRNKSSTSLDRDAVIELSGFTGKLFISHPETTREIMNPATTSEMRCKRWSPPPQYNNIATQVIYDEKQQQSNNGTQNDGKKSGNGTANTNNCPRGTHPVKEQTRTTTKILSQQEFDKPILDNKRGSDVEPQDQHKHARPIADDSRSRNTEPQAQYRPDMPITGNKRSSDRGFKSMTNDKTQVFYEPRGKSDTANSTNEMHGKEEDSTSNQLIANTGNNNGRVRNNPHTVVVSGGRARARTFPSWMTSNQPSQPQSHALRRDEPKCTLENDRVPPHLNTDQQNVRGERGIGGRDRTLPLLPSWNQSSQPQSHAVRRDESKRARENDQIQPHPNSKQRNSRGEKGIGRGRDRTLPSLPSWMNNSNNCSDH